MTRVNGAASAGLLLALPLLLVACGGSDDATAPGEDGRTIDGAGSPAELSSDAAGPPLAGEAPGTAVDTDGGDGDGASTEPPASTEAEPSDGPDSSAGTTPPAGAEPSGEADGENGATSPTAAPSATGADLSGGDDDSPTATESRSLAGPFVKDTARGAGPPSAPRGLVALLTGENWVEMSWTPAADDQSVEAYEIYRDGELVYTVRGDTGYEFDYRSWIATSYIDCNYTRYASCEDDQPQLGATHTYTVVAVDNEGMRSPPSEPATFTLETPQDSTVDLTGFALVFEEEFDRGRLDPDRWKTVLPWGEDTVINGELQRFVNLFASDPIDHDPFVFTGDTLRITATRTPPELLDAVGGQPYLSGVITTADNFAMTYGYVEMRGRVAGGQGLLSTFYLFNDDYEKNKPEIDIVEYIGSRPDKMYQTYHYYDSNRARYPSGEKHSTPTMETDFGADLSGGFHTYGVLWEPGLVVWYIDGEEVRRIGGVRVSDEPMNIIAQLVAGSEWIGEPDAASIPASFEIDYIRAWQRR